MAVDIEQRDPTRYRLVVRLDNDDLAKISWRWPVKSKLNQHHTELRASLELVCKLRIQVLNEAWSEALSVGLPKYRVIFKSHLFDYNTQENNCTSMRYLQLGNRLVCLLKLFFFKSPFSAHIVLQRNVCEQQPPYFSHFCDVIPIVQHCSWLHIVTLHITYSWSHVQNDILRYIEYFVARFLSS